MTQLELFADDQEQAAQAQGCVLVLVSPSLRPTGAEAAERKLARVREVEDKKREKKGMVYA